MRETPLPGQAALDVIPYGWLPDCYTVPFLDGRLLYWVNEEQRFVGVLSLLR
jgi:hypothetical protein